VKIHHRLDQNRLAEVLAERGLCEPQALREALQLSGHGNPAFAEAIVQANLVGDWELSKVVAEIYNLAFVPLNVCPPDSRALDGLDLAYLVEHGLVPMGRCGTVLTVAMPGMVAADVLANLPVSEGEVTILPVVGSVLGNRRWIELNLLPKLHAALPSVATAAHDVGGLMGASEWGNIFDQGEANVQFDLQPDQSDTGES
jgi:hypothetical protein